MHIYQGNIITCDRNDNVYQYLVEDKGKIVYVGDELPQKYKNNNKIKLEEKSFIPSFCDD